MSYSFLQEQLEQVVSGKKLKLTINDNRSTMVSVKWEPDCTKVSLHRMFLNAPKNVMQSLACYVDENQKLMAPPVKAFISEKRKFLDYSHSIPYSSLHHQGEVYNLREIYDALNREYFNDSLNLKITWFGARKSRNKNRITFGLYCDTMKLIKVSRLMDTRTFPDYVVSFVIYHEMLHHICPPYINEKGFQSVHNPEFKNREAQFKQFRQAKVWFKNNENLLFP